MLCKSAKTSDTPLNYEPENLKNDSDVTDFYPGEYSNMQRPSPNPNPFQLAQMRRKFGMFIHFGINTFNNTEWSNGTLPVESYRPGGIDADDWGQTARDAGMKYVVWSQSIKTVLHVGSRFHKLWRKNVPREDGCCRRGRKGLPKIRNRIGFV